jgi:MFS family permease
MGGQMTSVAVAIQVFSITHSSLAVGFIGLALAVPLLVIGLLGGSLADALDRRKLVLITTLLMTLVSVALAVQAALDLRQLWLLYALVACQSSVGSVDGPTRRTFIPRILPQGRIAAATALAQLSLQISVVVGPLVAGLLLSRLDFSVVYGIDAATFLGSLYAVLRLRPIPRAEGAQTVGPKAVAAGLRYVWRHPILAGILLVDLDCMVFGMPRSLFPALATGHFGGGPATVGLLYAAPAIGGVVSGVLSGPLSTIDRQGLAVLVSASVWGSSIALFAATPYLWFAVALLAVAGAADVVTVVLRNTMVQVTTPDAYLGRVNSAGFVVGAGGPHLGDLEGGALATLTTPVASAIAGGVACVAGVSILALSIPGILRFRAPQPVEPGSQ